MDIDRLQSVGLVIIRPKSTQSDRKSDLLKIFRPESVKILKKRSPTFWRPFLVYPGYPPLGVPADLKSAVKKYSTY